MKRIRTRIGSILLSMALILTLLPVTALAGGKEARYGGQEYDTLELAVEAAAESGTGGTIELLTDVVLEAQVTLPDGVTLDGQGQTISVGSASWSGANQGKYVVVCGSNVTVRNVTIDAGKTASGALQFYDATGGKIEGSVTVKNAAGLGLNINASQVTATGTITYENNGANSGINVSWGTGSDIQDKQCFFDASAATLVGVAGIYTASSDVENAGNNASKFSIIPPADFAAATAAELAAFNGAFAILCAPAAAEVNGTKYIALATAIGAANAGDTVTLMNDCTVSSAITIEKNLTLDLNGHVVTNALNGVPESKDDDPYMGRMILVKGGASLTVNGTAKGSGMTIAESAATVGFIGVDTGSSLTVNGGKYTGETATYWYMDEGYPGSYIFIFETGDGETYNELATSVTLNDITAESNYSFLNGDTIWGDLTVNVTGGTYTATSDFLFHVDTMKLCPVNFTDVEATINGDQPIVELDGADGTFKNCTFTEVGPNNNNFSDSAIFVGFNGKATIESGTYKAAGTALCIGSSGGTIHVTDGTFSGGKYAAQAYISANYATPSTINISGGNFAGEFMTSNDVVVDGKTIVADIIVSGGYFTSDPSAYLAAGKAAVASDKAGYAYMVGEAGSNPAAVVAGDADVGADLSGSPTEEEESYANTVANALTDPDEGGSAAPSIDTDVLNAAAGTVANQNTVTADTPVNGSQTVKDALDALDDDTTVSAEAITIVVQPYLDIKVTDVSIEGETKTVTLDITPMYITVATTANVGGDSSDTIVIDGKDTGTANAIQVGEAKELPISKPVEVTLSLPVNFVSNGNGTLYVKHVKDGGATYYYTGSVASNVLTFTNPHGFSEFTLMSTSEAKAETGGVGYPSLLDAINAVTSGGEIKVLEDGQSAVVSREVTFTLTGTGTAQITAGSGYQLTKNGSTYTVTRLPETSDEPSSGGSSSGGSGSSDDGDYSVSVPSGASIQGGSITVSPRSADKGDTVTITVKPDDGYVLDELTVTTRAGAAVDLTRKNSTQYTFTMPGSSVVIDVSFVREGTSAEMDFTDVAESFWACSEIQWAYDNGFMNGTSAATFNPNGTVNRQQVWMILARMAGADPANMAAAKTWAVANGISDGTNPTGAVTRQQLVALLYRFAAQNGYDVSNKADLSSYPDAASVASYAAEPMAWAVANGIIGGTTAGTLNAAGNSNRAQLAVILWRFYQTTAG